MKRKLVEKQNLKEETIDAIQSENDVRRGKTVPPKKAYPMRPKSDFSKSNSSEIGLPDVD